MTDTERKLIELLRRALPYVRRQTYPGNSPSTLSRAIELQTDIQEAIDAAAQAERRTK